MALIKGCDVSSYQGQIDHNTLRKMDRRIDFAMVRIAEWRTDSTIAGMLDPQFENNIEGFRRNGIMVGVYNRANPVLNTPEQEASAFATRLRKYNAYGPGWIVPALDLEDTTQNWSAWLREFITAFRDFGFGPRLTVYSAGSFFDRYLGGEAGLDNDIKFWVAHTNMPAGSPLYRPARTQMHQWSHTGTLPGVQGNVDLDVLMQGVTLRDIAY